jgi:threonine dehydrogenase-like Zn-dependent dehydrogenase
VAAPGVGELREEALAAPGAGEALVRAIASGISRGTEGTVFAGRVPAALAAEMRAPRQIGDFPAPVKYGYASVGEVEIGPAALLGRRVFCLHPHQDRYVVPLDALAVVPEGVPARRAALAANLETAVNALWDAPVGPGDRVAVVGAGSVGLCVALLAARVPGTVVEVVDVAPARRELAARLGLGARAPGAGEDGACDLVVHASGRAAGLGEALRLAGVEATVLELSWYGAGDVAAPLGEHFHPRRLRLQSSQVGRVAPSHRSRWTHARRLALALALLGDAALAAAFDALVGAPEDDVVFEALPARMAAIVGGAGAPLPLVRY